LGARARDPPGVETGDTLLPGDPGETGEQTAGKAGLGDQSNPGSLEGAEGDIGKELGDGGSSEVDGGPVLTGRVDTDRVDGDLFPELVSSELEGSLDRVSGDGRSETGQEGTGTLLGDDLSESANHTLYVGDEDGDVIRNISSLIW
jgi:hypothetical protein